jgi:hypothetical protein
MIVKLLHLDIELQEVYIYDYNKLLQQDKMEELSS